MDTLTLRVCANILIRSVLSTFVSEVSLLFLLLLLLPRLMMLFYNYWLVLSFCCAFSPLARRNKTSARARGSNKKEIVFCELSTKYGKIKLTSPGSCALSCAIFPLLFCCTRNLRQ